MPRGLALFSGGLDSILAVRVLQEQDVELTAVHFSHVFAAACTADGQAPRRAAQQLGVSLCVEDVSEQLLEIVRQPRHGYGSGANPCIDCRVFCLRRATHLMRRLGADFLVTGEVLGERPMSQRRDAMNLIEKEAGVPGLVLRPLSAQLMKETIPEKRGWVNRQKLLSISGRSRRPQFELARRYGITEFPSPAGGCLLTDPGFAARMRDLLCHRCDCDLNDVQLLKIGRHFRVGPNTKVVVGRNEQENHVIERLARKDDMLMEVVDYAGPVTLIRGTKANGAINTAACMTVRYGKAGSLPRASVRVWGAEAVREAAWTLDVQAASEDLLDGVRIGPPVRRRGGQRAGRE